MLELPISFFKGMEHDLTPGSSEWISMNARKKSSGAAKDRTFGRRVRLPAPVAAIYRAVAELEALYPGRKFTPDGTL